MSNLYFFGKTNPAARKIATLLQGQEVSEPHAIISPCLMSRSDPARMQGRCNNPLAPLYYGLTRLSVLVLFFFAISLHAEESSGKVFYPAPPPAAAATPTSANPVATSFFYLIFLGGMGYVAYLLWKKKVVPQKSSKAKASALDITTTRPLGNRQFLVVVNYKDKELLLGVGQGFITKLDSSGKTLDGAKVSQEAK